MLNCIPIPMEFPNNLYLNTFQDRCSETAIYPSYAEGIYSIIGLIGEIGEVAEKMRDYYFPAKIKDWDNTSMFLKEIYQHLHKIAEIGLSAGKLSKLIRDKNNELTEDIKDQLEHRFVSLTDEQKQNLSKEIMDCFWFGCAALSDFEFKLGDKAEELLNKLQKRKEEGKISGDGDSR